MIDFEQLQGLVEIMAAERTKGSPHLFEECVQEGMIAAWQASRAHPNKPAAYYNAAARYRVLIPLRGRSSFGASRRNPGSYDASTFAGPLTIEIDGREVLAVDQADPAAERAYDEIGYGPIHAAVAALPAEDRALVYGRYWADEGYKALSALLGRPEGTLSRRWITQIRPVLRDALAGWEA